MVVVVIEVTSDVNLTQGARLFIYNYPPPIDTLVSGMVVVAVLVVMTLMVMVEVVIVVGDGE